MGFRLGSVLEGLSQTRNFRQNSSQRLFLPFRERVCRVAIRAAQIAGGQPNKYARQARKGALTLQAEVNLVDHQFIRHPGDCNSSAAIWQSELAEIALQS